MPKRELWFSITAKDFKWEFFKTSGPGGQNKNKRDTACRCIHPPSQAIGVGTEEREQGKNRRLAFERCTNSPRFRTWLKLECCRRATTKSERRKIEEWVESEIANPQKIMVEVKNERGEWVSEAVRKWCGA